MSITVQAVYENGVLRPLEALDLSEHQQVTVTVSKGGRKDDDELLDREFLAYCEAEADDAVSLESVRRALAKIPGSLAGDIRAERDER
jgi:predicted DNA-binding antitoxin AbrB/MazE fold protein